MITQALEAVSKAHRAGRVNFKANDFGLTKEDFKQLEISQEGQEAWDTAVIHGNLTPKHIYLKNNGSVKVGGFAIDQYYNTGSQPSGNLLYMPPEVISGESLSEKSDVWSLGCVAHEFCSLEKTWH